MSFIEIIEDDESFDLPVGESTLHLRRFDSDMYRAIEKKHTKKEKNFRTGGWIKEVDDAAVNEDLLDYMITGWDVVRSPSTKQDVPCTKENKNKLPGSIKMQITEACDASSISPEKKTSSENISSSG